MISQDTISLIDSTGQARGLGTTRDTRVLGAVDDESTWRVNYDPRHSVGQRGGDLIVEVGAKDGMVKRVLRGQ